MHKKAFDGIFVHETRLQTHNKWDYTSSSPCYMREERSLAKKTFSCKTWKIFYDSLNFLRISFPYYIYIIFGFKLQHKRNGTWNWNKCEHWSWSSLFFWEKTRTTNKSLKNNFQCSPWIKLPISYIALTTECFWKNMSCYKVV